MQTFLERDFLVAVTQYEFKMVAPSDLNVNQSYTTAVTTSTFPNMHTFLRGPEFCLMVRKLKSSCRTSKNVTLEEQYPRLCSLIGKSDLIKEGLYINPYFMSFRDVCRLPKNRMDLWITFPNWSFLF